LLEKLNEAKKKHGRISVRFIKILLTGSGAAGKTSFSHLLLSRKITQHHHSTKMINTSHAVSLRKAAFHKHASNDQKVVWAEMDPSLEMKHLHTVLLTKNPRFKRSSRMHNNQAHKNADTKESKGNVTNEAQSDERQQLFTVHLTQKQVSKAAVAKQWFDGILTKSIKVKNLSIFDSIVTSIEPSGDSATTHQPGDVLNIVTLLDTGGQPQYIHLLPTVNIYPTVNFVIHNLSKDLNDQVLVEYSQHGKHTFQPYHLSYSNLDMIKLLTASNNDCLEMSPPAPQLLTHPGADKNSYLCFVGTHVDKVTKEIVQETAKVMKILVRKTDCKSLVLQNSDGSVLFPVDNTTAGDEINEDPVADVIRNKIEGIAENKDVYELPITWMLLELEIRQVCTKNRKLYISFSECVILAKSSRLMSNPGEVKNALIYHHILGVLLFFDDIPGLQDYVIIDHQWWFDTLSNIISFTFKEDIHCHGAVHRLKYNGILCREILQIVEWEGEIKEEYFLLLLSHLKIIAPLHTKNDQKYEYFIPYILPAYTIQQRDMILQRYGDLQGQPLLIQFKSGILPRGLFCCLVVHLLQNLPLEWKLHFAEDDDYHLFSNLITFSLPNAFSLSFLDKVSHLEVQIRHKVIQFATTSVATAVHVGVYHKIMEALSMVCDQLNFSFQRVQVGFTCHCGNSFDTHIAIVPIRAATLKLFATCSANSLNQLQLKPSHLIWFNDGATSILGEMILLYMSIIALIDVSFIFRYQFIHFYILYYIISV